MSRKFYINLCVKVATAKFIPYRDYLDAKAKFPEFQHGTWGGAGEKALFGDIGIKGISKGRAIEVLLSFLGAKKEQTIAFGDAKADIPMFEYCNYGVAMENGGREIKAIADYVTSSVEKDGLKNAFEHLGLI